MNYSPWKDLLKCIFLLRHVQWPENELLFLIKAGKECPVIFSITEKMVYLFFVMKYKKVIPDESATAEVLFQ